ncbi:hypothetical protein HMPREF1861_00130 [Corynebacterium kroppenstedtii]|nr:hypothetical protein HMPREF1861_00130 [Corynebacterium kroppenstedtii]
MTMTSNSLTRPDGRTLHADLVACRRHSRGHSTTKAPWTKALLHYSRD